MKPIQQYRFLRKTIALSLSCLIASFEMTSLAHAAQVRVNLLGQPCVLKGPFEVTTLELIHSIGPAQIYPNFTDLSSPQIKHQLTRALNTLQNTKKLPPLLEPYRERLTRRLKKQQLFIQALQGSKPTTALAQLGPGVIPATELKKFQSLVQTKRLRPQIIEQAFEIFNNSIEPDPESEFHRMIKKLQIEYQCSFEENEPDSNETQNH